MDFAKARGRREHLLDAHRRRRGRQAVERVIVIVEQISRRFIPRKNRADVIPQEGAPGLRRRPAPTNQYFATVA
jgi:hypothetical protein